jgi:hypothetical protein
VEESENTYEDNLKEHLLVDLHELLIPLIDVGGLLARVGIVIVDGGRIIAVVLAPLNHLSQDRLVDLAGGLAIDRHGGKAIAEYG